MGEKLGDRVRRRRLEKKLGLREAASILEISPTYLSRIETSEEKSPPAEDVVRRIATLLEDNFDELMALAGRVPADVAKIIASDPTLPDYLRSVQQRRLTGQELKGMLPSKKGRK